MLGAGAARFLSKILTFLGNNLLAFRQISAIFGQCFAYIWARFSWIWANLFGQNYCKFGQFGIWAKLLQIKESLGKLYCGQIRTSLILGIHEVLEGALIRTMTL